MVASKRNIVYSQEYPEIRLRSIEVKDLDYLRCWKNACRSSFFYQGEISEEEQKKWFEKYLQQTNDCMFMVEEKKDKSFQPIGCMGFRMQEKSVDIYNIIRGKKNVNPCIRMGDALVTMCSYIERLFPFIITCKVIVGNPAVQWYEKNAFQIIEYCKNYVLMKLDTSKFKVLQINIVRESD